MSESKSHSPILCLYSGGTDSTLAAALAAQQSSHVILLTLKRYGIFASHKAAHNAVYLKKHFDKIQFKHYFEDFDKEYTLIAYDKSFRVGSRFDIRNASMCGLCKLAMHWRTIKFCKEHDIHTVFDGSVKKSRVFPEQNKVIMLDNLEKLYLENDIDYQNPVFDLDTQEQLYQLGIMSSSKIKGSSLDIQPICSQQLLFAKYAELSLAYQDINEYEKFLGAFYAEKIKLLAKALQC